ncbi:MAG TPA: 2TM domain-containing protein [Candidatus Hydrogenedentes bacterium]|nr:2TM domain-containing protein [Candidatus Hydrogenedentota bacterium]
MEGKISPDEQDDIYSRAICRARMRLSLYIHATVFASVILLLVVINLLTAPRTLWVVWPVFGWGAGLSLHWFLVTKMVKLYQKIKSEEIARELED